MKPRDMSVYDFTEDDELTETLQQWSSLSNPKIDNDVALTKYQFLQHTSSGPITQIKEIDTLKQIHVVSIDDDDRGLVNDVSDRPQESPDKVASKQPAEFGATSDTILQQACHHSGDSVNSKSSSDMEIRMPYSLRVPPENGHMTHISPTVSESPCSNGSVDTGDSDDCDSVHESSPSTPGSEQEEIIVSMDGLTQEQLVSGLDMEEMDTSFVVDYVIYDDKYFPACMISFFETSFKIEMPALEEEHGASTVEWNIDDIHGIESQWISRVYTAKVKVRLLTNNAVQENECGTKGIEVLEFLVHDPDWLARQEWIIALNVKYQAVWSIGLDGKLCEEGPLPSENCESSLDPYLPNFEEPFDEVVYPKGDADAVSISKRDVDLLEPDIFLNDTIIDFYMKYLQNGITSSERGRFHFFNSFFFRKLADPDKNTSGIFDGKAAFQRVRKWTRKLNLFEKDYIFIPVNYNLHWSLIVICHPGEVANFEDENVDEYVKVPCVVHMDSIKGSHAGLKDLVQSYLLEEWKEKQKETSENVASKFMNLRFLSLELPQQENCSDCGLFLLHYAELFIAEAPKNFSPFRINKFEKFLKPDWFPPAEASLKRVYIQRLIYELLGRPLKNASPCNHEFQPSALPENNENDNGIEIVSERSPEKCWNSLHSQSVGLLDMPLYRTSECTNVSGLGMTELLEQCQQYNRVASFGDSGCSMPLIREEIGAVDHLAPSTLGQTELQPKDGVEAEACHIAYTPSDLNQGFQWNLELPDQGGSEDKSSPSSNYSSDDSQIFMITECEPKVQRAVSGENKYLDQPKENVDSLTESYASASSDMMETPAEDSQELAKMYGSNELEDFDNPKREEAEEPSLQEFEKIEDGAAEGINAVVEDSYSDSDEEQATKRIRLSPADDGERELVKNLSEELEV